MKIALDASMLPELSPADCLDRAKAWEFDGLVIPGGAGLDEGGGWAAALGQPAALGRAFSDATLSPVALQTGLSLDHPQRSVRRGAAQRARRAIDAAVALGCERVVCAAANPGGEPLESALTRDVETLANVANYAAQSRVTVLLDNGGTPLRSRELWHLRDASGSPAVRYAFRPLDAQLRGDSLSLSIKQLAGGLEIVFVCDAECRAGEPLRYTRLGEGGAEIGLLVELLKGVAFDGWLCVSWPELTESGLRYETLAHAARFLRAELARPIVVLAAYKGDKHAPRFAARKPDRPSQREAAES